MVERGGFGGDRHGRAEAARVLAAMGTHRIHGAPARARLLAVAFAACASACVTPNERIEGEDQGGLIPALRLSADLLRRPAPTDGVEAPAPKHFRLLLDVEVSRAEGDFDQRVVPPGAISLGGQSFSGNVDVDFALLSSSVDVRAASRFPNGLGIDGFVGLASQRLDIELSQGAVDDSERISTLGPMVGARLSWTTLERLCLFAEGRVAIGFGDGTESVGVQTWQVGADLLLAPHVTLMGAWRDVHYEAEFDDFQASDIEIDVAGPLLSLGFSI